MEYGILRGEFIFVPVAENTVEKGGRGLHCKEKVGNCYQ